MTIPCKQETGQEPRQYCPVGSSSVGSHCLCQDFLKILDSLHQGIFQLNLRLPLERRPEKRNVRPSDFRVIGGQQTVRNLTP